MGYYNAVLGCYEDMLRFYQAKIKAYEDQIESFKEEIRKMGRKFKDCEMCGQMAGWGHLRNCNVINPLTDTIPVEMLRNNLEMRELEGVQKQITALGRAIIDLREGTVSWSDRHAGGDSERVLMRAIDEEMPALRRRAITMLQAEIRALSAKHPAVKFNHVEEEAR